MSYYDGPSIFDRKDHRKSENKATESKVDFTLDYAKTMPEEVPTREDILEDAKQFIDHKQPAQRPSLFKRNDVDSDEPVLNKAPQLSKQLDQQKTSQQRGTKRFKPTYIPSIYKGKKYISPEEQFIHQKEWYESLSQLLAKKATDYILPESSAKKVFIKTHSLYPIDLCRLVRG